MMAALPIIGGGLCSRRKVWLTPTTRVLCSNAAKTRKSLKFAGMPQTNETISAARPKFTILRGHVEEVLLISNLFPIVDKCLSCEDIARQSCAMVLRCVIFASYIFSVACSTFQTCILNSH